MASLHRAFRKYLQGVDIALFLIGEMSTDATR